MPINDNHIDVARYRGEVRPCEFCKNSTLPPELRVHCKFCLTNGYVAQCLKCDGSGSIKAIAPWDNSSEHHSTCDICGGSGVLPARKPIETANPKPEAKTEIKKEKEKEKEPVVQTT